MYAHIYMYTAAEHDLWTLTQHWWIKYLTKFKGVPGQSPTV